MEEKIVYTKYSDERKKGYAIQTAIVVTEKGKIVKKKAIFPEGKSHIKRMVENCQILTDIYGKEHVAQCLKFNDSEMYMEYVEGERLSEVLERFLIRHEYDEYGSMIDRYIAFLKKSCSEDAKKYNLTEPDVSSTERVSNIDMIFDNVILRDNEFVIIDYEWLVPKIDYRIVLSRALSIFYIRASREEYIEKTNEKLRDEYEGIDSNYCEKVNNNLVNVVMNNLFDKYRKIISQSSAVTPLELQNLREKVKETISACEEKDKVIHNKEYIINKLEVITQRQSAELSEIKATRGYKFLENIRVLRDRFMNN